MYMDGGNVGPSEFYTLLKTGNLVLLSTTHHSPTPVILSSPLGGDEVRREQDNISVTSGIQGLTYT